MWHSYDISLISFKSIKRLRLKEKILRDSYSRVDELQKINTKKTYNENTLKSLIQKFKIVISAISKDTNLNLDDLSIFYKSLVIEMEYVLKNPKIHIN